jgi:hypothetical protein
MVRASEVIPTTSIAEKTFAADEETDLRFVECSVCHGLADLIGGFKSTVEGSNY